MARARFLRRVLRAIGREIGEGVFSSAAAQRLFQCYFGAISQNAAAATSAGGERQSSSYPVPPEGLTELIGLVGSWEDAVDVAWETFLSVLGREVSAGWCVLEPGCGCGRLALNIAPLVRSYVGFDVDRSCIEWCNENIPEGEFHHVDAKNEMYNPGGSAAIRFPCEDSTADLIYMASVITHLRRGDFEEFLRESARCLKPGGRMLFSCYLQSSAMQGRDTVPNLEQFTNSVSHILDEVTWVDDPASNLFVVYNDDWLIRFADSVGLSQEKIEFGFWGGIEASSWQDWVMLKKR